MPRLCHADVEFYESQMVMVAARALLDADEDWETLSHRRRQTLLDRGVAVVQALLADGDVIERFGVHYRRHIIELATHEHGVTPDPAGPQAG